MAAKNDKLQIVMLKTEDLIPYDRNPRDNRRTVEKLTASIKEFGFKNPVILDENNIIVSGHARLKAAQLLGLREIPCVYAKGLTGAEIKAFRIADNKTAEVAGWDYDKLCEEMTSLLESGFNLDLSGFNQAEQYFYTNHQDAPTEAEKSYINAQEHYADENILRSFNVAITCATEEEMEMLKSLLSIERGGLKRLYRVADIRR